MAGFNSITGNVYGSVMSADNVSFDGTERGGIITANGELLIGSAVAPHIRKGILTSTGGSILITNGQGTINLETLGANFSWNVVTGTSQTADVNKGYICTNAGLTTVTLPTTFAVGDTIKVVGTTTGLIQVNSGAGTSIKFGTANAVATINSIDLNFTLEFVGVVANTTWITLNSLGNFLTS